ncbi:HAD family hydrolase [Corynebacterium lactis]|uniref:Haloacid dehalogenase n=1 Tax=Corynebacterium lactis RW2-5 TaxID=1408189 RepID=A0A0K2GYM9_9CORY|nr:HAD-IA family hydrolase [Corynebacterium lactis]ALA66586.1 haloacid dehalogenase [Corynebacterium lactis RW2-5]
MTDDLDNVKGFIRRAGAVLFDLDGVITPTADIHKLAWADMFRAYFAEKGVSEYTEDDYFNYLDGRRRDEGIAAILESRHLSIPHGSQSDSPDDETIVGLGKRKNADFLARVEQGIDAYPGSVKLLESLASGDTETYPRRPQLAVVSSSKNAVPVLEAAGLRDRFVEIVDGVVAHDNDLPGKPAPDTFVFAAEQLGVEPRDAVVVEDAISGVQAGAAGAFGLVIGVDRGAGREALLRAGADVVVEDLAELL